MEQFIKTKFFLTLQETLQTGIEVATRKMTSEYDEFATFLFAESNNSQDRTKYREMLVYTLSGLTGLVKQILKKKDF